MSGRASDDERKRLWDELSRGVDKSRLVVVHLTKGNEGFGFNIRGGFDHPHVGSDPGIFITTVRADSTAGIDGRLEPGDRILAVNATSLECVTHDVAVNEFRKAEESVSLLVEKNAEAQLLTQQVPNSPEETVVDGPPILGPCEEEPPHPAISLLKQFYESKLGALSIGLAVGSLAVFVALRIYKAAK
ncbi:disks large homolog 1-like isoform X1 [Orbicella faveolata]|uniref:disks large homolog 1-like isoform X1 n=1 Tax=Orbicella faveolata TaxID=48498 RepID=UPI0009E37AAF|nr:disks large homolog 1-like isoform X1 [Orbicella faveolata]